MYLDEILVSQSRGKARGVTSICSAHPYVLKQALLSFERPLIEATCNQVNQFGGYTGMTPRDFVRYVRGIAEENDLPFENIILGGDHLGPSVWQDEPADVALGKAEMLVHAYVEAGFVKIHLDCSMRLADDPEGALDVKVSAERAARLARIAEITGGENLRYVIGTEVPLPGGAMEPGEGVSVTKAEHVQQTIETTRDAFYNLGLQSAWERVVAVVVQPGVEYGDDFVLRYQPDSAREISLYIETQPFVYEAHSTDYQTSQALASMVQDHFAILKVGPALTFAFREAVFALAMVENELFPFHERSNIISLVDEIMVKRPEYWIKYYHGDEREKAFKRKYSLSDRIRYYWTDPLVQHAFNKLMTNLHQQPLPATLLDQYMPDLYTKAAQTGKLTPEYILLAKIQKILEGYALACSLL
jgi:D-tagatose-1,6-bisphosphate aldolase subunit GatZ/KbaZ